MTVVSLPACGDGAWMSEKDDFVSVSMGLDAPAEGGDVLDGDGAVLAQTSSLQAPAGLTGGAQREAATADAPSLGTLGRYQLLHPLGKGGMAEVFLAVQDGPAGFQKHVVIKKSDPELAKNPKFVEMFLREAKIAARLNHSNVVQVFELGQEGDVYFIAMEHIDGISLQRAARRAWSIGESIPMEVIVKCVADAARGLHYAHTWRSPDGRISGLVHRDISPDNLMLTRDGVTKVLDFGIAKMAVDDDEPVTKTGEIKGKIPYMPPEQLKGVALDGRADLWSLGITLYWLLTGARPFAGNEIQTLQAILHDEPLPPRQVNPLVPVPLERLTMRLLEKDRDRRFATGQQVADALMTLLGPGASANTASDFAVRMLDLDDPARNGGNGTQAASQSVQTVVAARPHTEWLMKAAPTDSPSQEMWRGAITGSTDSGKISPPPPPSLALPSDHLAASGPGQGRMQPPPVLVPATAAPAPAAVAANADADVPDGTSSPSRLVAMAVGAAAILAVVGLVAVSVLREDPTPTLIPPGPTGPTTTPTEIGTGTGTGTGTGVPVSDNPDAKPDEKPDAKVDDKPDTKVDDKVDDKPDTKVDDKPDTKVDDKPAIKRIGTEAPATIRWETTKGRSIGKGSGGVVAPPGTTAVVAVDPATGGRTTVKLEGGRFDYSAVKKGRLVVRAQPYAEVKLGPKTLGTTPFQPVGLVAGTYKVVLTYEGKRVERTITIDEGREAIVAVNMLKE